MATASPLPTHLVQYLAEQYRTQLITQTPESEERFATSGTYDMVERAVHRLESRYAEALHGTSHRRARAVLSTMVPALVAGGVSMLEHKIGHQPLTNELVEAVLYTGALNAIFQIPLLVNMDHMTRGMLEQNARMRERYAERMPPEMLEGYRRRQEALESIVQMATDTSLQAQLATLNYIKEYDPKSDDTLLGDPRTPARFAAQVGCGTLFYGALLFGYNALPFSDAPVLPAIIGCIVGATVVNRVLSFGARRDMRRMGEMLKPLRERDRNQLIGGLLQRWYGGVLPRSPAMP